MGASGQGAQNAGGLRALPAARHVGCRKPAGAGTVEPQGPAGPNYVVSVTVDDPDAHYARARAAGAEILRELKDEEYGSRGYMAQDPEGNQWYFGTYRPGGHWTE